MDFVRVSFTITTNDSLLQAARDILANELATLGFDSFVDTTTGIDGYIPRELFSPKATTNAIHDFPLVGVSIAYECATIEDQDWNQEWETHGFAPIDIDSQILIYDARQAAPTLRRPIEIAIEARQAFGTGTHETTRLILAHMLSLHLRGSRVLDCGCGTGVLSLAASMMGASEVVAYDIDKWSVDNTLHNASLNGLTNIRVFQGDANVLTHTNAAFDLVVANINRNILMADLPRFSKVLRPTGIILLSGFYTDDVPMLMEKASSLHLKKIAQRCENNWTMIHLER